MAAAPISCYEVGNISSWCNTNMKLMAQTTSWEVMTYISSPWNISQGTWCCFLGTKLALKRRWGGGSGWGASSWGFGGARSVGLGTRWQGAGISRLSQAFSNCSGQSWDRCQRCHKAQQWREAAALPALVEQRLLHFPATARASAAPSTVASSGSGGTSWRGVGAVPCKGATKHPSFQLTEACAVFRQKNTAAPPCCFLGTKLALKRRWGGGSEWGASWCFGRARSVGLGTRWQGAWQAKVGARGRHGWHSQSGARPSLHTEEECPRG